LPCATTACGYLRSCSPPGVQAPRPGNIGAACFVYQAWLQFAGLNSLMAMPFRGVGAGEPASGLDIARFDRAAYVAGPAPRFPIALHHRTGFICLRTRYISDDGRQERRMGSTPESR